METKLASFLPNEEKIDTQQIKMLPESLRAEEMCFIDDLFTFGLTGAYKFSAHIPVLEDSKKGFHHLGCVISSTNF